MSNLIYVRHNAEIAHRLSQLPGKCQQIHGHSLQICMTLVGELNKNGILEGLDFGAVKRKFRAYIDTNWDHRLLMNLHDPLVQKARVTGLLHDIYPGLTTWDGDPTIENLAQWLGEWTLNEFGLRCSVDIQETNTNGAIWESAEL